MDLQAPDEWAILGNRLTPSCRSDDNPRVDTTGYFPQAMAASTVTASASPLAARSRAASGDELQGVPWLARLDAAEHERVVADLRVVNVEPGELVCRIGRPVTYWFGLVDGLLKMSNDDASPTAPGMP